MAETTALTEGLRRALEHHLEVVDVVIRHHEDAADPTDASPSLLLLKASARENVGELTRTWRERHPDTPIALIVDDPQWSEHDEASFLADDQIRGVLPLWLKLDVWLAAVSLVVSGGEYYPSMSRRRPSPIVPGREPGRVVHPPGGGAAPAAETMKELTRRELEILELVSVGFQNKSIASRMDLSEHTVKVHVHNVIQKLHVTNRTQAAAVFRRKTAGHARGGHLDLAYDSAPGS